MSKTKKHDTSAKTDDKATNIAKANWSGLRDSGFALMSGAADNKNLGTQTLAASILALLAERPVSFDVGEAREHGDHDMLMDCHNVNTMGATGDEKKLRLFRAAVFAEILPSKPEADTKNGVTIKGPDYVERMNAWNAKRNALSGPFKLACAMAYRGYDAGDFLIGQGFNVERKHIVPAGFSLDTGNVSKPQSPDDVICLNYAAPLVMRQDKARSDQTTHIRDTSANIGVVRHVVESYIKAQSPAEDSNVVKGLNLVKALAYIAKIKETPKLEGDVLMSANTASAVILRIIKHSEDMAALAAAATIETDGKGNVKAA